jgi:ADP-ribose pyrophosphatase YjhB (NUDIX family)
MVANNLLQIRATGVLIDKGRILIVKQRLSDDRSWSLPGGRVEQGETLEEAILREIKEETGLDANIIKLLYVCDKLEAVPSLIHITFLLEKIGGEIRLPTNEFDQNPIHDVKMVPIEKLTSYHFSEKFMNLVKSSFPDAGSYKGHKSAIGL